MHYHSIACPQNNSLFSSRFPTDVVSHAHLQCGGEKSNKKWKSLILTLIKSTTTQNPQGKSSVYSWWRSSNLSYMEPVKMAVTSRFSLSAQFCRLLVHRMRIKESRRGLLHSALCECSLTNGPSTQAAESRSC